MRILEIIGAFVVALLLFRGVAFSIRRYMRMSEALTKAEKEKSDGV